MATLCVLFSLFMPSRYFMAHRTAGQCRFILESSQTFRKTSSCTYVSDVCTQIKLTDLDDLNHDYNPRAIENRNDTSREKTDSSSSSASLTPSLLDGSNGEIAFHEPVSSSRIYSGSGQLTMGFIVRMDCLAVAVTHVLRDQPSNNQMPLYSSDVAP